MATIAAFVPAGLGLAPSVAADATTANLRTAIASARGGSCGPLRSDPVVERVAEAINRSVSDYQNLTSAGLQPIDDPGPGLKALGYSGNKSKLLRGYGKTEADAIKILILQGFAVKEGTPFIADCAFKDYGASVIHNDTWGYMTSTVLAGP
ncbi:MAG: hypothetical protein WB785_21020 [Mycobacterium sp.]|uniref:hypothetical protein n=1 Tax=Mycobacterium sp. TaxID=1785 RepID=UPI003C4AA358